MIQQLQFDGLEVAHFGGAFTGTFDMEENFPMDAEVAFLVVAKVVGAKMTNTKQGDLKRVNSFEVLEVAVTGQQVSSRRMVNAANQTTGQLTITGDGKWDEGLPQEDEQYEERVVVGSPVEAEVSTAPRVSTTVPDGVPHFGKDEYFEDTAKGWS